MPLNFSVPQFIDIEDKLIGPFTFKQFLYILGGAGASFILWRFLPSFIALIFIVPIGALAAALAFLKVNRRPFIITFVSALKYYIGNKTFLWRKTKKQPKIEMKENDTIIQAILPATSKVTESKLKDIAWSLDVKE